MSFKEWLYNEYGKKVEKAKNIDAVFFNNVITVLKYRGITMCKFEESLGLCQGYLSKHSKGTFRMFMDDACRIANKLNVSIDRLLDPNFIEWAMDNLEK